MKIRNIGRVLAVIICCGCFMMGASIEAKAARKVKIDDILLQEVNNVRAYYGLDSLEADEDLTDAAKVRAAEISVRFSHIRPDGRVWYTVDSRSMYGETIGRGFNATKDGAADLVSWWMSAPSHADMLLDPEFTTIGFGVYKGVDGRYYWTSALGY